MGSVARYSYGVAELNDDEKSASIALGVAREISSLYDDPSILEGGETPCCDVEQSVRAVSCVFARDLVVWRGVLAAMDSKVVPAKARASAARVRACARWKIEKLVLAIHALESASLERTYTSDDEELGDDHVGVVEIEVR